MAKSGVEIDKSGAKIDDMSVIPGLAATERPPGYKRGRPPKYNSKYADCVVDLMAQGLSITQCAARMGVDRRTLYEWQDSHKEFSLAVARGVELALAWWEDQISNNLDNGRYNTSLLKLAMANRFGWSDKVERKTTVTHEIGAEARELLEDLRKPALDQTPLQIEVVEEVRED